MSKFDKLFEIPQELVSEIPKVTILGFEKLLLENYKYILEYQDVFIRVKMKFGIINIYGVNLEMIEMTKDDLIIMGTVESIEFEKL
ncbi:MAG: YabP/YqfC family sporulation protein [Clostridia bacterium]|nr:YabP/YqfC family sporulation protein [Clostridia bacterium]